MFFFHNLQSATRTGDILCPNKPLSRYFFKTCPSPIVLLTASFIVTSHFTSADGQNDCQRSFACSAIALNALFTHASFLTHTNGHPISSLSASSGWLPCPSQKTHACPHLSLPHSIINTSLDSSFFFCPGVGYLSALFCEAYYMSYDLLCLFWKRFCALESTVASLLQHRPKPSP